MPEERFGLGADFADLEAALERLAPAPARIDRDKLMYAAGTRAATSGPSATRWLWPAATAAMTLVSATLAVLLAQGHRQQQSAGHTAVEVAAMPGHTPAVAARNTVPVVDDQPLSQLAYLSLRQTVIDRGVDTIPSRASGAAGAEVRSESLIDLRRRLTVPPVEPTINPSQKIGERP